MSDKHDEKPEPVIHGDGEVYGVLAEFDTPGELAQAARKVRDISNGPQPCMSKAILKIARIR